MRSIHVAAFAALVVALPCAVLQAEPSPEDKQKAKQSFLQAEAAFARKEYAAAAASFEQAGRFAPHPKAFLNAAEAWELAGEHVRAADNCVAVKRVEAVDIAYVREAEARLAELTPKLGTLVLEGPPSIRAKIDGGEAFALPATRYVLPGVHRVTLLDPVTTTVEERAVELAAGAQAVLRSGEKRDAPKRVDRDSGPKPTPSAPRPLVPLGTWISFGLGAACGVGLGVTGGMTLAAQGRFEDEPTREHADAFYDLRLASNVLVGVTSAAFATGAVIWIVDAASGPASAWMQPLAGPGLAGAKLGTNF